MGMFAVKQQCLNFDFNILKQCVFRLTTTEAISKYQMDTWKRQTGTWSSLRRLSESLTRCFTGRLQNVPVLA